MTVYFPMLIPTRKLLIFAQCKILPLFLSHKKTKNVSSLFDLALRKRNNKKKEMSFIHIHFANLNFVTTPLHGTDIISSTTIK